MYDAIFDRISYIIEGHDLTESLSAQAAAQMRKELGTPTIMPQPFDVTLEAWLHRLSLWGKVKVKHSDPELSGWGKKQVSASQMIKKLADPSLLKAFGVWSIDEVDVNKLTLKRDYVGLNGKRYKEQFFVEVDLKPELKQALKRRS